ncbi:hypothetical protein D3C78_1901730 [compost metagenome]
MQRTGLSPNTVARMLLLLQDELGILREITGQRRNRVFTYPAYLDLLNQEFEPFQAP